MKKSSKESRQENLKRLHILYQGRVQGVGFRFTAERVAADAGVTGWVKNMPSGDVEVLAEGSEKALQAVLGEIQNSVMGRYIDKTVIRWEEYRGEFSGFRIEFVY